MQPMSYARHRFPPVVIRHAVWLYLRFTLSYRDVEDLLAERGLEVSNETGVLLCAPETKFPVTNFRAPCEGRSKRQFPHGPPRARMKLGRVPARHVVRLPCA